MADPTVSTQVQSPTSSFSPSLAPELPIDPSLAIDPAILGESSHSQQVRTAFSSALGIISAQYAFPCVHRRFVLSRCVCPNASRPNTRAFDSRIISAYLRTNLILQPLPAQQPPPDQPTPTSANVCMKCVPEGDPFAPQATDTYLLPQMPSPPRNLKRKRKQRPAARPDEECSFCQGDKRHNRAGYPERLISCVNCGRSGILTFLYISTFRF